MNMKIHISTENVLPKINTSHMCRMTDIKERGSCGYCISRHPALVPYTSLNKIPKMDTAPTIPTLPTPLGNVILAPTSCFPNTPLLENLTISQPTTTHLKRENSEKMG